jgi:hypothetical protein
MRIEDAGDDEDDDEDDEEEDGVDAEFIQVTLVHL